RPEPGSNSPIKFVTGSKLANHFNDRLINAFAVQFSKSIFSFRLSRRLFYLIMPTEFLQEVFSWLVSLSSDNSILYQMRLKKSIPLSSFLI
ncbi:hypothetical protein P4V49_27730, partial [Brevibacillus parabrevis]|uniref:hypothetical protein n=1 Tax=Brevibacillus parabrevis TaxID=54914 RepID=UPI002E2328F0|nr:hypothetical protein [Brevibacillus parabrevis]